MPTTIESRPIQGRRDLEPEEFVSYQLHRTQAVIRTTDVLTAAAVGLLMVAAYLLVFVVFDQWVIPGGFGYPTRVVMLMGLLAGLGVWGWRRVIGPWRRQVSALFKLAKR